MVRHGSRTSLRAVQRRGRLGMASSVVLELLREVLASAVFACGTCAPGRGLAASTKGVPPTGTWVRARYRANFAGSSSTCCQDLRDLSARESSATNRSNNSSPERPNPLSGDHHCPRPSADPKAPALLYHIQLPLLLLLLCRRAPQRRRLRACGPLPGQTNGLHLCSSCTCPPRAAPPYADSRRSSSALGSLRVAPTATFIAATHGTGGTTAVRLRARCQRRPAARRTSRAAQGCCATRCGRT